MDYTHSFVFIVLWSCTDRTQGLECYKCSGGEACMTPGASTATETCSGECQVVYGTNGVTRSCTPFSCYASAGLDNLWGKTTCCDTDKCNNADVASEFIACYKCAGLSENSACPKEKFLKNTPNPEVEYCSTNTKCHYSHIAGTTSRGCSEVCIEVDIDVFGIKTETNCCAGDRCNGADNLNSGLRLVVSLASIILAKLV